jgi:perosamine synthetase
MIPRLKPYLGKEEIMALFQVESNSVELFEQEFANTFEAKHGISFSYGRSALWAFFKTLEIKNAEIIMPAYSCTVVAHAIVLSHNIPRFVDITLHDYNMDLDQVEAAINEKTKAIIATHLFGYPLDVDRLNQIVRDAEARYSQKIWIVQDCAHSFGARWNGKLVCNEGDVALFGLNISKMMTSIFGGMLTINNSEHAEKIRFWRDTHFHKPSGKKAWFRKLYLLAVYLAFHENIYSAVNWLQDKTQLLDSLTKSYHLDDKIHFPPDYLDYMLDLEAAVGLQQLKHYSEIIAQRRANAEWYNKKLNRLDGWVFPPIIEGATYSHYVIRVPDRRNTLEEFRKKGIQLGQLIEYSIPDIPSYKKYSENSRFPNSLNSSQSTINFPLHVSERNLRKIIEL